jgi:dihydroneopterin aldolase/2-amino-4-hydroxy-6-hydroxymethyldihydropteridine diphosphokinase
MADETPARAFVAVGSNIEPERHIPAAAELLAQHVRITGVSAFYRTPAVGRPEQPAFLNGVLRIETPIPPRTLKFDVLRAIETRLGRVRTADPFAARCVDLDLALYGTQVIREPDLHIPDPDIRSRPFLAIPLRELEPDLVLPDTGQTLASIIQPDWPATLTPDRAFTHKLRDLCQHDEQQ